MKKFVVTNLLACLMVGVALTPVELPAEECSREILISFYYPEFVKNALEKYNVPKDKWDAIVNELSVKDKEVIKTIEQRAASMPVNPLKDPAERQNAMKLLREVPTQIFADSLKANGVTDEKVIQQIYDDIHQQKIKKCTPTQAASSRPSVTGKAPVQVSGKKEGVKPGSKSDAKADDDDDDDDDDDEDVDEDDKEAKDKDKAPVKRNVVPVKTSK